MDRRVGRLASGGPCRAGAGAAAGMVAIAGVCSGRRDDRACRRGANGGLTVDLRDAVGRCARPRSTASRAAIVLIDPGHGGPDPGRREYLERPEKDLTLVLASELRDLLAQRGRVRVALTREDDHICLSISGPPSPGSWREPVPVDPHGQRAESLARGRDRLFLVRCRSDAEAARFAQAENAVGGALTSEPDDSVRFLLSDLALRDQMDRFGRRWRRGWWASAAGLELRPEPHRFAAFHVLRRAEVPAVLFEAGYISNADDEALLIDQRRAARRSSMRWPGYRSRSLTRAATLTAFAARCRSALDGWRQWLSPRIPHSRSVAFNQRVHPSGRSRGSNADGCSAWPGSALPAILFARGLAVFRDRPAELREIARLSAAAAEQRSRL